VGYNILNGFIDNPIDIKISHANSHGSGNKNTPWLLFGG
jgi:hypothetical protein